LLPEPVSEQPAGARAAELPVGVPPLHPAGVVGLLLSGGCTAPVVDGAQRFRRSLPVNKCLILEPLLLLYLHTNPRK